MIAKFALESEDPGLLSSVPDLTCDPGLAARCTEKFICWPQLFLEGGTMLCYFAEQS